MNHLVEIVRGRPDQREALAHMFQLYAHDFADFVRPGREYYLSEDGRFDLGDMLESYWTEPDRSVWFIRDNSVLAGFALLNTHTHSGKPADYNMGEFFVSRPHRGGGVASRAFAQILKLHPGVWELAISIRNIPAQKFWPRAISDAGYTDVERLELDDEEWLGPVLRFRAG